MSNNSITTRGKRWAKFLVNYGYEKLHGLDFSMFYVGEQQRNVLEYHGYSMTDAGDMKRMLRAVPVDPADAAFIDVGCGKGMCMKCAVESGYKKVAGLDLDQDLLKIARSNMKKLKMDVECIHANAVEYDGYKDFDVFYFYNPFGRSIFEQVISKIVDSQNQRNRDIWVIYYHPKFHEEFEKVGFIKVDEFKDTTRDTNTFIYHYPRTDRE